MKRTEKNRSRSGLIVVIAGLLLLVLLVSGLGANGPASAAPQACVPGPHSGVIAADEEWCLVDSPHLLSSDVTVSAGVNLTVEPGVIVQGSRYVELLVQGHLEAVGTPTQPIIFTSSADTGPTEWSGLAFDGGSGHLSLATVRYSGDRNTVSDSLFGTPYNRSAVTVRDGTLHLEDVTLSDVASSDSSDYGLLIADSVVTLTNSLFTGIGGGDTANDVAVYVQGADSVLEMHGNTFTGNIRDRVLLVPGAMMGHDTTLYAQPVFDGYELQNDFTVPAGITLTVEPDVVVKGRGYVELLVHGHLEALGTPTQPITFTSSADTGPTQWSGLVFDGGTGHLRQATVRYAGQRNSVNDVAVGNWARSNIAIRDVLAGEVRLENVTIRDIATTDQDMGVFVENSNLVVVDSLFTGIGDGSVYVFPDTPLYITGGDSEVTLTNNTFTANNYNNVVLQPGAMMNRDANLTSQDGLDGYLLQDDFTVPAGVTLTLEPDVTLRAGGASVELLVEGNLEALGTASQPITFTSSADSGPGQWAGLVFDGGTGHLRHATVRYAGQRNTVTDAAVGNWARSNIAIRDVLAGEVRLENVTISDIATTSQDMGVYVENSIAVVEDSLFTGIGDGSTYIFPDTPLYIAGGDSEVTLTNNTFTANNYNNVVLQPGAMMNHNTSLPPQDGLGGYLLQDDFTVPAGVTLTVEPGVILRGSTATELLVRGHLQAIGTPTNPITFTSSADSGPYQWAGLLFDGSGGAGTGHLRHASIRYGGSGTSIIDGYHRGSNLAAYDVVDGEVRLEHVLLEQAYHFDGWHYYGDHGLYVNNSQVAVASSTIVDNCDGGTSDSGVYVTGNSQVLIDGSVIQYNGAPGIVVEGDDAFVRVTGSLVADNTGDGVENQGLATVILSGDIDSGNAIHRNAGFGANQTGLSGLIIATYNYWGDPSGPIHAGNPGGLGEEVTDRVLYDPWLTEAPSETPRGYVRPRAFGPSFVSPGETVNLGFLVHNVLTETLESAILVAHLPREAEYVQSSPSGEYWPQRHQVVWKLGDMTPDEQVYLAVQVRYVWGLPSHKMTHSIGLLAAGNQPSEYLVLDEYLNYEEVTITSFTELNEQELAALLAADPELNALYQDAESQGFAYYGAARSEVLSTGDNQVSLPMIDTATAGEEIYLYDIDTGAHRVHGYPASVLGDSPTASFAYDYESARLDMWPPFDGLGLRSPEGDRFCTATEGCDDFGYDECLRNCLIRNLNSHQFDPGISQSCQACYKYGASCGICASHLAFWRNDVVKNTVAACDKACDALPEVGKCTSDTRECANSGMRLVTPCEDCELNASNNYFLPCPPSTRCVNGSCYPIVPYPDTLPLEVLNAGDPNEMYGPAEIAPGQTITYTISFENVGEGTAYGVFVDSQLPGLFDPGTLQIQGEGVYFSGSRTLMWEIGELGPGAGGSVSFEVQVPTGAISGTVVVANATVYFPSVPETTPTGDVVSVVGDVVAHSQQVETVEGVAVPFTLSGYTPTGSPLQFHLNTEPLNGQLSGSPPNLTYTPAANFEGRDSLSFSVDDGVNTSRSALVAIGVNTGAETIPPEVLFTAPSDGATDVKVYMTPVITDTYHPTIRVQFDEPIDASTVTTDTLYVMTEQGQRLDGKVEYDGSSNVARFIPSVRLVWDETYTATVTTAVHDTSGNPMEADYVWSFHTEVGSKIYLPAVLKN